jgi:hypothetical protein
MRMPTLFLALFLLQQQPPRIVVPENQTRIPASVEGVVIDSETKRPLPGVTVVAQEGGGYGGSSVMVTDNDGAFRFPALTPGQYRIEASRGGYVSEAVGTRSAPDAPAIQVLNPGQSLSGIRLVLTPGGVISGRLVDERGEVVVGAVVQALKTTFSNGLRQHTLVQSVTSNDLGEYRLFMLKPGQYSIALIPGTLWISNRSTQPASIPLLYPGTIDIKAAQMIDLQVGQTLEGVNFSSIPTRNRRLAGGVQGNGSDPAGVVLSPLNGTARLELTLEKDNPTFEFADVVPGPYMLVARTYDMRSVVAFDVRNADMLGTRITLGPGFKIPVRARIEGHPPGDDPDVEKLYFAVRPEVSVPGLDTEVYSPFANGGFRVEVLKRDYWIDIARTEDYYIKSITLEGFDVLNQGLHPTSSLDVPMEIVVDSHFGEVQGAVATPGATVVLVPDAARRNQRPLYKFTNASAGLFHFTKVPPGDYKLFAWSEDTIENGGPWLEAEYLRKYEDRATPIRIEADRKTILDRAMPAF